MKFVGAKIESRKLGMLSAAELQPATLRGNGGYHAI